MQKIYRILRNNIEQGPFDLEELVKLPVKSSDLIWQDGKSAAWLYPTEIEVLKSHVSTSQDPASNISTSVYKQQPRPPMPQMEVPVMIPAEEEELSAEKLERKAEEIYKRVQAFSQNKEQDDVEVKYARSLDDLKQEYAQWLHVRKKKKRFIPLQLMVVAACLVVLFSIGYFMMTGKENGNKNTEPIVSKATDKTSSKENKALPVVTDRSITRNSSVDEFIDSVRRVLAQQERERNSIPIIYYKPKPLKTSLTQQQVIPVDSAEKEVPVVDPSRLVDMHAKYFAALNGKNLESVEVTIQNNSNEFLKTVSVDVYYYRKGERLFDKETLYFSNILPGNSYTLSVPANKKALEAKFKLGPISWSAN